MHFPDPPTVLLHNYQSLFPDNFTRSWIRISFVLKSNLKIYLFTAKCNILFNLSSLFIPAVELVLDLQIYLAERKQTLEGFCFSNIIIALWAYFAIDSSWMHLSHWKGY